MNKITTSLALAAGAAAMAIAGTGAAHADQVSDTASTTCIVLSSKSGFSGDPAMDAASIVGVAQALGERDGISTVQAITIEHLQVMRYCPSLLPYWNQAEVWAESVTRGGTPGSNVADSRPQSQSPVTLVSSHGGGSHGGNHGHGAHHAH